MALTKEQIKIDYPLPAYNYRVDVAGESITFSEVSGLDRAYRPSPTKKALLQAVKQAQISCICRHRYKL